MSSEMSSKSLGSSSNWESDGSQEENTSEDEEDHDHDDKLSTVRNENDMLLQFSAEEKKMLSYDREENVNPTEGILPFDVPSPIHHDQASRIPVGTRLSFVGKHFHFVGEELEELE